MATKRKILFDYYQNDSSRVINDGVFAQKISRLKESNVKTVFIITSEEIELKPYLNLVNQYEDNGFTVKSVNIETLDKEHLPFMKNTILEINESFKDGNCLIVSFEKSVAVPVMACFYVYAGINLGDALDKVKEINENLILKEKEIGFVRDFQKYLGLKSEREITADYESVKRDFNKNKRNAVLEVKEKIPDYGKAKVDEPEDTYIKKEGAAGIKPGAGIKAKPGGEDSLKIDEPKEDIKKKISSEEPEDESAYKSMPENKGGFGKFYSSIRFKLITITSIIIIISLTGMISLATYYFKNDNKIRVQENNLYVSEVIALKVKSDFQAIVDKAKLIASELLQNISAKELENYSRRVFSNDRDFIFMGISASQGKAKPDFIKNIWNNSLMIENQITQNDIDAVTMAGFNIFSESFKGEIAVQNVSQGFRTPVIGISIPLNKDNSGRIQAILISYIKLDRFLEAFQSTGITTTYMVNSRGDILAHADSRIVTGGGNYINIPIVKEMITSSQSNGQGRYKDENSVWHLGSFHKIGIGGLGVIATVKEDVAYQAVYAQQRRNLYLTGIVLTVVILIIYFFGKTLTTPIIRLLRATKRIKSGDFQVKIRPVFRDEIGELTNAFIEMGQGLEEREKIKSAFGKFVNPELAEMITKNGIQLGGERKKVAIMFSDIRNFTSMSEKLQPEEVVEFLNSYMTKMVGCIDRSGGVVDKFIGDAIMAEWGVPVSRGNDTENAINGTLLMRGALMDFNRERKGKGLPPINIGCGINTGPVLAGQIGSEDRMEYTVIGDAVNLASRIEELNKPFGTDILISEDSYRLVKDIFAVEKMAPIKVKGKKDAQQIYAVIGRLDDNARVKDLAELRIRIGTKEIPFNRRKDDLKEDAEASSKDLEDGKVTQVIIQDEVKYEILN